MLWSLQHRNFKRSFQHQQEATHGPYGCPQRTQNGPRGQRDPRSSSGGMSPITMAILGLLAYKAVKGIAGGHTTIAPANPREAPGGNPIRHQCARKQRRARRFPEKWIGRSARRCCRRDCPERRAKRPPEAISAERPQRNCQLLGRHWTQQDDIADRFGKRARIGPRQCSRSANGYVAR